MAPKEGIDSAYRDDLNDFMLFDRKNAIIVKHDSSNQFVAAYKTNEKENIEHLTALRNHLLNVGMPLADF